MHDRFWDWRLGIQTRQPYSAVRLGFESAECHKYTPSEYRDLFVVLDKLAVSDKDVFLDMGAGLGRAVFVAAMYPFRRVMGVDKSDTMIGMARENLSNLRGKAAHKNIEFVQSDATTFIVPDDITVVFLYCPFHGSVLTQFMGQVAQSLTRNPRPLTIVGKNVEIAASYNGLHMAEVASYRCLAGGHMIRVYRVA